VSDERSGGDDIEVAADDLAYRYTLVVGPDGADRAFVEGVLLQSGLEVAASVEEAVARAQAIHGPGATIGVVEQPGMPADPDRVGR